MRHRLFLPVLSLLQELFTIRKGATKHQAALRPRSYRRTSLFAFRQSRLRKGTDDGGKIQIGVGRVKVRSTGQRSYPLNGQKPPRTDSKVTWHNRHVQQTPKQLISGTVTFSRASCNDPVRFAINYLVA